MMSFCTKRCRKKPAADADDLLFKAQRNHPYYGGDVCEDRDKSGNQDWWSSGWGSQGWSRASRDMRGLLPRVPHFDGDQAGARTCYQKYKRRVENFVEIARELMPEAHIGPRLYYEITGKAFEHPEGTKAEQFSGESGKKVLLTVLEHFDE